MHQFYLTIWQSWCVLGNWSKCIRTILSASRVLTAQHFNGGFDSWRAQ